MTLTPQHVVCKASLADMYSRLGHFEPALKLRQDCLKGDTNQNFRVSILQSIARIYQRLGDNNAAINIYQKWLEVSPDDPIAIHMLAAATGETVPDKPDENYVRNAVTNQLIQATILWSMADIAIRIPTSKNQ